MNTFQQETIAAETVLPPPGRTVSVSLSDAPQENAAAADLLLETAENVEQKRRTEARFYGVAAVIIVAAFAAFLAEEGFGWFSEPFRLRSDWLLGFQLVNVAFILWSQRFHKKRRAAFQIAAAELLPFSEEPRFLLPLIDCLNTPQTPEWKSQAYPILTERLWNLSPTDAILSFDDTRRAALRGALGNLPFTINKTGTTTSRFDDVTTDFAVALMKTLAGMGDKKSVPVFQKIIKTKGNTANETVVRDAAREYLAVLTQKQTENETVRERLAASLREQIRDPQKVLEEYLDSLPPEIEKAALVDYLRAEQPGVSAVFAGLSVGMALGTVMLLLPFASHSEKLGFIAVMGFCAAVIVFVLLWLAFNRKYSPDACKIACELAKRSENDTRLLPLLLQVAQSGLDKKQDDIVKKALVRLFPLLKPGDAALVPPAQRAYLRSWLKLPRPKKKQKGGSGNGNSSQTLTIAALDALAAVGDTKALPAAEATAQRTVRGTYRETELHEAAVRCVEALRARQ